MVILLFCFILHLIFFLLHFFRQLPLWGFPIDNILALFTFAKIVAENACVKALTVFFWAFRFLAVATSVRVFDLASGLYFILTIGSIVRIVSGNIFAGETPAILGALHAWEKTLAVHFHAFGFFTVASLDILILWLLLRIYQLLLLPRLRLLLLLLWGLGGYLLVWLSWIQIHPEKKFKFCL